MKDRKTLKRRQVNHKKPLRKAKNVIRSSPSEFINNNGATVCNDEKGKKGSLNRRTKSVAQKSKLTPRTQTTIVAAIKKGLSVRQACLLAGVHFASYYRWMKRGEKSLDDKYERFHQAVKKAEAQCELTHIKTIEDAAKGHLVTRREKTLIGKNGKERGKEIQETQHRSSWRASMAFLERKFPERWCKRDRMQISAQLNQPPIPKEALLEFLIDYIGEENSHLNKDGTLKTDASRNRNNILNTNQASKKWSDKMNDDILIENR